MDLQSIKGQWDNLHGKDKQSKYGMTIICAYRQISPQYLIFDKEYQRKIEKSRIKKISDSIKKYGYWPQEVIIVTKDNRVIDGQHRAKGAIDNNIPLVPISIVSFKTKEKEAEFFADKNNWNSSLKPVCFWKARYVASELIAQTIYKLENDPDSLFYQKIALEGKQTNKSKFTITEVLSILNSMMSIQAVWNKEIDNYMREKVKQFGYLKLRVLSNNFLKWFFEIWGSNKRKNPIPYKLDSIRAILQFYKVLEKNKIPHNKSILKMQSYQLTADFVRATQTGKTFALVTHFNYGRKNRISYE